MSKLGSFHAFPLSPIAENLFMEEFEIKALASSPFRPKLWKGFIDGML